MVGSPLSVSDLARHVPVAPEVPRTLRQLLRRRTGPVRLESRPFRCSVMTHNMALLVAPGDYLGRDRDGAIAEIETRIRDLTPDIVGLCEVFSDGERAAIRHGVADLYPHSAEGPDEDDVESDGGLLVLSRHPILWTTNFIYRDCDGNDCYANKGVIHMRVRAPDWPISIDVFYTHMQDISTDDGASALYKQLSSLGGFIELRADPTSPVIVMGDLNVPAQDQQHYQQLFRRTANLRDCWTLAGNSVNSGATVITDSSFYEDDSDRPARNERLDYVLLRAGTRAAPIVSGMEVLRLTRNDRLISDHLGLRTVFTTMAFLP
jgi:endonuclease/exonuclease/phosphatase family metal-dependent hydrolase